MIPLACGILCLGLGLKARGRRIFLGEAALFLIAGACALVYHLYMPGERDVMWQWNIYIPWGPAFAAFWALLEKERDSF